MTKLLISALALASSVLFTSLTADPALADRRVALVIGNAQYKNTSLSLPNPKNDADDVAATLRTLGFEVVLATNADKRALDQAMQQFARQVTRSEEHTSELQSQSNLVCRLLLEKKNPTTPLNDVSTWIKIMEYMGHAKPIVTFDLKETRVSAVDAAIYVEPNDGAEFAKAIGQLM